MNAPVGRRSFLGALCAAGVAGSAGCLGGRDAVSVLAAGSLAVALDERVGPAFESETGVDYRGEYHGTNAAVRMVLEGQKAPDVVIGADVDLLRERLYGERADWDVEFAANSVGIAYGADTWFGERLEAGEPWYELAREADAGELAISDPDVDPLGYRALLAFELAEREHGLDGFAETVAERAYREPEEPQLLAGVETGARAAAVAYRNMAADRDLPFREFPDAYNFANPDLADRYARVSFTTSDGYTATGRPVTYGATVLDGADDPAAGRQFVAFLAEASGALADSGLTTEAFPRVHGDPPAGVMSDVSGA